MDITIRIFYVFIKLFPYSASSNIWEGGNDVDELTIEAFEIEDKEDLIDEIMNKYGQEVLQLVYSYVNNKEVAEDVTQDIFVKCYKSLHTYKGNSNLKTWLWRIAINHCKDYLKSWYNKKLSLQRMTLRIWRVKKKVSNKQSFKMRRIVNWLLQ